MKVAFLDRDGTIIADYPDAQWAHVQEPLFLDGAIDALRSIRAKGYAIIVVTNQYLIGEGFITPEQYQTLAEQFGLVT